MKTKLTILSHIVILVVLFSGAISTSADNLVITTIDMGGQTMNFRDDNDVPVGLIYEKKTFEVLEVRYDDQGRPRYRVSAWIPAWLTEPAVPVDDNPYLTSSLPPDTVWAVLLTDNIDGVAVPRMLQDDCEDTDRHCWEWQSGSPTISPSYPETTKFATSSNLDAGKYASRKIDPDTFYWVTNTVINGGLQLNDNAVNIVKNPGSGWINREDPEFLSAAGNWAVVLQQTSTAIEIACLPWDYSDAFIELNGINAAWAIHRLVGIHEDGYKTNISSGGNGSPEPIYLPVLCPGPAWIHTQDRWADQRYWIPPQPPFEVTITSPSGLTLRSEPIVQSDTKIEILPLGTVVMIQKYYPTDSGVWGWTGTGWISLQYLSYPGDQWPWYGTTWELHPLATPVPRAQ